MASTTPLIFRWGIIATGGISTKFVKDILIDPKTRDINDIVHKVTAVGSRSVSSAKNFVSSHIPADATDSVKAYGSYAEVFADPHVDAVYIGTPHPSHFANARDAILAKKHVLCEKPVTTNAAELKELLKLAKEHSVFFMEAMWTRFHPLVKDVKALLDEGSLGPVNVVHADLSEDFDIENIPKTHRMLDPSLGGGALLDLGPYPMIWAILTLYESTPTPPAVEISGAMLKTPLTGVDASTSFTLTFPSLAAQAILSCSLTIPASAPGVTIRCKKGCVKITPPIWGPREYVVEYYEKVEGREGGKKTVEYPGGVMGWCYEADEVARCVREGKLQSELWGWDKSVFEMEIFDEVRRQGGYVLPEGVEQVV